MRKEICLFLHINSVFERVENTELNTVCLFLGHIRLTRLRDLLNDQFRRLHAFRDTVLLFQVETVSRIDDIYLFNIIIPFFLD